MNQYPRNLELIITKFKFTFHNRSRNIEEAIESFVFEVCLVSSLIVFYTIPDESFLVSPGCFLPVPCVIIIYNIL